MEELELPWAAGAFVADIFGLACRQISSKYSGFLSLKVPDFFWGGAGTGYHCQVLFVSFWKAETCRNTIAKYHVSFSP